MDKLDRQNALQNIWAEIFAVPEVRPGDSFFDLGGDSLQVMTMLFRVNQLLGIDVTPDVIFDHPTLGELSDYLDDIANQRSAGEADGQI